MCEKIERTPEQEIEWLRFLLGKKDEELKRIKRMGRPEAQQKVRKFISKIVEGAFTEYINTHGNQLVQSARSSIVKRLLGHFCSMDTCRILVQLVMDVERKTYNETQNFIEKNEKAEKEAGVPGVDPSGENGQAD